MLSEGGHLVLSSRRLDHAFHSQAPDSGNVQRAKLSAKMICSLADCTCYRTGLDWTGQDSGVSL